MPQGSIKKLVAEKGFGFISGDREELFFHRRGRGIFFEPAASPLLSLLEGVQGRIPADS